ncbi:MAG: Methyltransferase type 12 [Herbinix sp.]|jgi:ubiquinone/menaquinone biosynthesis C-methylase UbiE|nr:Methyltransferase type 12 [Herbinix sp.]
MGNTEIFDTMANVYDTSERASIAKLAADAIRGYIVDGKSKSAIDFGCGTGLVGMNLLEDFGSILFLDSSQPMVEQIKQKISDYNLTGAQTLCFDFEKENNSEIHADYIFMSQVLLHIKDIEWILSRLYQVLNAKGHLIIVDFNKNEKVVSDKVHNGFEVEELIMLLGKIGFSDMKSKTFYTGSKIFMNQDASLFVLDATKQITTQ